HLTVQFTNGNSVFGTTNDRASVSGTCQPGHYLTSGGVSSHLNDYINASCFTMPAVFGADDPTALGFGNAGVGILDGPGQNNWDIALIKRFKFGLMKENFGLDFRTEFFNAFNHPQFNDPDVTLGDATFGQITSTIVAPRVIQFALKLTF